MTEFRNQTGRTVHIRTYGCQMNVRDSEAIGALLVRHGYQLEKNEGDADIVLVNTCSVRGKAEDKALGKLRLVVADKVTRPGRRVGAVGCMVQRLGAGILKEVKGLDFAAGTHRLSALPAMIDAVYAGRGPLVDISDMEQEAESLTGHPDGTLSSFVNILLGCDRHCAYCIVPAVRGREWSRPAENVLTEIRALAGQGCREITLLGQSVISYGLKNQVWPDGYHSPGGFAEPLPRLLEAVSAVPGVRRIRFTSGHPSGCTAELARAMAEVPGVCDHLHLPVQSGSDAVLKRMRRGYTAGEYLAAVRRLRKAVPTLALTSDVIVGFPGESEADFDATRRLMDEAAFDNAYIFKYSPREGTPAAAWVDDVTAEDKARRNRVLLEDQDRRGQALNEATIGQEASVLVEGPSLRNKERWAGRSSTNKIVIFDPSESVHVGDIVTVCVERVGPQVLYGTLKGESHS
ncbi:MAG: tRNA (N6-isopentenyl adenosine(37)-C2)-methylthiotransferase MiaB [bacterium]